MPQNKQQILPPSRIASLASAISSERSSWETLTQLCADAVTLETHKEPVLNMPWAKILGYVHQNPVSSFPIHMFQDDLFFFPCCQVATCHAVEEDPVAEMPPTGGEMKAPGVFEVVLNPSGFGFVNSMLPRKS